MSQDSIAPYKPMEWNGILIVGERPNQKDFASGIPFRGGHGLELQKLLAKVGILLKETALVYAYDKIPPQNDIKVLLDMNKTQYKNGEAELWAGKYSHPDFVESAKKVRAWIRELKPKMIITLGEGALRAVLEESGVDAFRGSMEYFEGIPVMPTQSPARIFATPEVRFLVSRDLSKVAQYYKTGWPEVEMNIIRADEIGFDKTMEMLDWLMKKEHLGVDIETRKRFYIGVCGFAWSARDAFVIPFLDPDLNPIWTEEQEIAIVLKIRQVLERDDVRVSGQNYHFDAQYLARFWGIKSHIWCDTMVAHHTCFSADIPKGLHVISSIYCDYYKYWKDESKNDDGESFEPSWGSWNTYLEYNGKDCCKTWEVAEIIMEHVLPAYDMVEPFKFQMDMWPHLLKVMLRGNKYDWDARKKARAALEVRMEKMENFMYAMVPEDVFPRHPKTPFFKSPTQLKDLFYNVLNVPGITKKNSKKEWRLTTDDEALHKIARMEPILKPLCEAITTYRSMRVFYDNFLTGIPDYDDYMRTFYKMAQTNTYRLASTIDSFDFGLNFQNLPKGNE